MQTPHNKQNPGYRAGHEPYPNDSGPLAFLLLLAVIAVPVAAIAGLLWSGSRFF